MDLLVGLSAWHAGWLDAQQAVREARLAVGMQAFAPERAVFRYESEAAQERPALHPLEGELLEQLLLAEPLLADLRCLLCLIHRSYLHETPI